MKKRITTVFVLSLFGLGAMAQTPVDTAFYLNNIEVTGSRFAGISGGEVKRLNVERNLSSVSVTAADAFRQLPSVVTDIEGGVTYRGSNRVGMLIDGIPYGLLEEYSGDVLIQLPALFFNRIALSAYPSISLVPDGDAGVMGLESSVSGDSPLTVTLGGGWHERYNAGAVLNLNPAASLYSLVSILVWWGVLQIRKNGASAWGLMNKGWDYKHCRHLYQVFAGVIILLFVLSLVAFGVANRKSGSLMSNESVWEEEDVYPVEVMDSVVVDTVAVDEEIVELEQDKMPKLAEEVIEIMGKDDMDKEEDDLSDEAEQMLRSAIKNIALPMDAGVGITITQVTLEGRYLVYTAVCDENLVDIEVLRLTRDDVKKNVEEYFVDSSASDPTLGNFMDLCITAHKGVAYKYVGDTSGEECWIRFSVSDLKRLVKKIQE